MHGGESARAAAEAGIENWVRVKADMDLGAYQVVVATAINAEPQWPEGVTFRDILQIAFRGHLIDTPDHTVVKRLRGLE